MKVVCVHYGDKYSVDYVNILNNMVKRYSDCELLCISDDFKGKQCETVMGDPDMGGWWNKLQLFKSEFLQGEKFLYLDLDIVITADLTPILEFDSEFATIRDFLRPKENCSNSSAILMRGGGFTFVYDLFNENPEKVRTSARDGDQEWITNHMTADYFPEEWFTSYRLGDNKESPKGKVVVFHGRPNPHEVKGTWVETMWR